MIVTPATDRQNQTQSLILSGVIAMTGLVGCLRTPWAIALIPVAVLVHWLWRRETRRRLWITRQPFPQPIAKVLQAKVRFYQALSPDQQDRFRQMVQIFLDEVAITGIRTEVDDTTRALVAASAVIPIFGFDDWEYSGLGEVLIYPSAYNEDYATDESSDRRILGMIGTGHLSGVMILSKPDLIHGFDIDGDKRNVGIHEFSHLVDKADGSVDGLPATIPHDCVDPWIRWVAHEIENEGEHQKHIDDYAFTNEAEYFAVLSEYFFDSPTVLQQKEPKLYAMMKKMYHQNPKRLLGPRMKRRRRVGRNSPCPCGSGEKYKRCCR